MNTESDKLSSVDDLRIKSIDEISSPERLINSLPLDNDTAAFIETSRNATRNIVMLNDPRLLAIAGPCSIHNPDEALEIADNLVKLQKQNPHLFIIMRTYFEKPRTTVGWKGLLNDPKLNGECDIEEGLKIGRKLLLDINELGIPCAVEFLDTLSPQYVADLITWGAIGARTTESQEHRKLVSGLSMPVGFKNGTDGGTQVAIDAIGASSEGHTFLSTTKQGKTAIVTTTGTDDSHLILRGGSKAPNYNYDDINQTQLQLNKAGINNGIIVDFSHANSLKKHENQPVVCDSVSKQIKDGNKKIVGVMIEANINEGNQSFTPGKDDINNIKTGVSITDACINLETNKNMLSQLNKAVGTRNSKN